MSGNGTTVFQRIRDAAVQGKGLQLSKEEARSLYTEPEVRERASQDDLRAVESTASAE